MTPQSLNNKQMKQIPILINKKYPSNIYIRLMFSTNLWQMFFTYLRLTFSILHVWNINGTHSIIVLSIWVQILDEVVYIKHSVNILRKGMNLTILFLAMDSQADFTL